MYNIYNIYIYIFIYIYIYIIYIYIGTYVYIYRQYIYSKYTRMNAFVYVDMCVLTHRY